MKMDCKNREQLCGKCYGFSEFEPTNEAFEESLDEGITGSITK
jgi:hypothetical protein